MPAEDATALIRDGAVKKNLEKQLTVNFDRLRDDIAALSEIGRAEDGGIYRMAFSDADMQARHWLQERIDTAGLESYIDGAANVFGRLPNTEYSDVPSVIMGSHIDTVPGAGHLDGSLGVLVALECLRRIQEEGLQPRYPIEIVSFTDEEGRFGGMLGSQALIGEINPDTILNTRDLDGVALTDAMAAHGYDAMNALRARRAPQSIHAYLELHIEQGPVLNRLGHQVGIVERITGLTKWAIRLIGAPDHAGTTPMPMRKDAFQGLAEFANELPRILEENGSDESVATIGKVELFPGAANTVPGRVDFSLDVRDVDRDVLVQLSDAIRRALSAIARRRNLMFEFDILSLVEPKPCDPEIVDTISNAAKELQLSAHRMNSGAAHDAQCMAKLTRVGMIFVPSVEGRSHSPAEWTHWEDIDNGANLALVSLMRIAQCG